MTMITSKTTAYFVLSSSNVLLRNIILILYQTILSVRTQYTCTYVDYLVYRFFKRHSFYQYQLKLRILGPSFHKSRFCPLILNGIALCSRNFGYVMKGTWQHVSSLMSTQKRYSACITAMVVNLYNFWRFLVRSTEIYLSYLSTMPRNVLKSYPSYNNNNNKRRRLIRSPATHTI